jgi:hypothetical protein
VESEDFGNAVLVHVQLVQCLTTLEKIKNDYVCGKSRTF